MQVVPTLTGFGLEKRKIGESTRTEGNMILNTVLNLLSMEMMPFLFLTEVQEIVTSLVNLKFYI